MDPTVAAFFATRRGAGCHHIDTAPETGVILRWKVPGPPRTPDKLRADFSLGLLHSRSNELEPIPVKYTFSAPGASDYEDVRDKPNSFLIVRPDIFTLYEIREMLGHFTAELSNSPYNSSWIFERFETSRWAAQAGALLRPTLRFPALASFDGGEFLICRNEFVGSEFVSNVTVRVGVPDRVVDAYSTSSGERFEFQHTKQRIDIEPEVLWPGPSKDLLFLLISYLAWVTHGDYFDEVRANFPWAPHYGLIDRGFYPDPIDETYERKEWELFRDLRFNPPAPFRPFGANMLTAVTEFLGDVEE